MNCWYCKSKLIWNSDYDLEDVFEGGEGIMTVLTCSNDDCGAFYECTVNHQEGKFNFLLDNKPKTLPKELLEQLQWAKDTLVGKVFMNNKTLGIYYVKGITIDTETLELRVIYVDGVSVNEWDRPLPLFIEEFTEYTGGRRYEE